MTSNLNMLINSPNLEERGILSDSFVLGRFHASLPSEVDLENYN